MYRSDIFIAYGVGHQLSVRKLMAITSQYHDPQMPHSDAVHNAIATECLSGYGNAIGSVRLSVRLFPLYLLNQATLGLDLLQVYKS